MSTVSVRAVSRLTSLYSLSNAKNLKYQKITGVFQSRKSELRVLGKLMRKDRGKIRYIILDLPLCRPC